MMFIAVSCTPWLRLVLPRSARFFPVPRFLTLLGSTLTTALRGDDMATSKKFPRKVGQRPQIKTDPMMQLRSDVEAMITELEERLANRLTALEKTVGELKDSSEDEERNDE
jgi:hypothetical protein